MNIKREIGRKELKKKLISTWYTVMKPIAYIFDEVDKYKHYRYKQRQKEIAEWSDEYAMSLCAKVLIKDMIKHNENQEEFIIARRGDEDYGLQTVRDYIISQIKNNDLKSWGFKFPFTIDIERIEKLTELLRIELEKYKEIKCEYIINKNIYDYMAKGYKKTLVVKLNIKS